MKAASLAKSSSMRPSREKVNPPKIFKHLHELATTSERLAELHCRRCQLTLSDPSYQCLECDEYVFHKPCAESPGNLELIRQNCPEYLRQRVPEYRFQEEHISKCKICEGKKNSDSNGCSDCLLETNIKAEFLPLVVTHESHAHRLNLIIMPLTVNYEFGCCGCGELGKSISYRCFDCNFNLHVSCLLLQRTLSDPKNNKQILKLTYSSLEENCWDKSHCEVCKKEMSPEHWFYYSPATESVTHIDCATAAGQ